MGGDGATTGNYALVYQDHGTAIVDYGVARYSDTGNLFEFTAVGVTSPSFWDGAALYVIALSQHATDLRVWDFTPGRLTPPSLGDGSNSAVFVKLAKPITDTLGVGLLVSYERSQMTLLPWSGLPPIRYQTGYLPSGGLGVHWHPDEHWQLGARALLNFDDETRDDVNGLHSGVASKQEYRLGVGWSPWRGTLLDLGGDVLVISDGLSAALGATNTTQAKAYPTVGIEQALVPRRVWVRAGLDETTWTAGMSLRARPFRIDLAYLNGIALARTGDQFGQRNASLLTTLTLDYESLVTSR
jgi:hypothetical protein